jgi:dipeptidyl aminopeptidase/acylaminoacyl peptidase
MDKLDRGEAAEVSPGFYLKKQFFETVDYIIPSSIMSRVNIPILIVHGDRDQVIPVDEVRKCFDSIKGVNDRSELYIVKGGDHTFSKREHTREVIGKTLEWIHKVVQ